MNDKFKTMKAFIDDLAGNSSANLLTKYCTRLHSFTKTPFSDYTKSVQNLVQASSSSTDENATLKNLMATSF